MDNRRCPTKVAAAGRDGDNLVTKSSRNAICKCVAEHAKTSPYFAFSGRLNDATQGVIR